MRSRLAQPVLWIVLWCAATSPRAAEATWPPAGDPLCTAANDQLSPKVCLDQHGGAIITWVDTRSALYTFDIYAQHVSSNGVPLWPSNGVPVCTATGDQIDPVIVSDGVDGAIIAWVDFRNSGGDVYVQRLNSSGVAQWTPNGVAVCDTIDSQLEAQIVSDGAGGAIVAWQDYRTGTADIFAQRVNASGVRQWVKNGVALCDTIEDQLEPKMASDGAGGAIVTWVDDRKLDSDIYAQRVNGAGVRQWTTSGVKVCGAPGFESDPVIASDGSGGAVVAWSDLRQSGPSFDIYAQRINAAGAAQWQNDGVGICTEESDQDVPVIASDANGGAIVAWEDTRNGSAIYAQRADGAGSTQWTADGIALCTAVGSKIAPRIVSDCAGGAIVTWGDYRGSVFNPDVYAQRVNGLGTAQWAANGIAVCSANGSQVSPDLVADGACGAIFAWEDGRSGTSADIYAQRVNGSGMIAPTVVDVPTLPARNFQLFSPRPNPIRAGTTFAFLLPSPQPVTVELFDLGGRRVRALAEGGWLGAGLQSLSWDGRDQAGTPVSAGVYMVRVKASSGSGAAKVIVLP